MTTNDGTELQWILSVIRRWWWLIAGSMVLCALIAFLVSFLITPVYRASALVRVQPATIGSDEYSTVLASELLAQTYSKMLESKNLIDETIKLLELNVTPEELAERIKIESIYETQLIRISAEDTNPSQAALIANTLSEAFIEQIQLMQSERFARSLTSIQAKMEALVDTMEDTQSQIGSHTAIKFEEAAKIAHLESLLTEDRNDRRLLQQEQRSLQLTVNQLMDHVKVIEAAQVPETPARFPYLANVLLLVGQTPTLSGVDYSTVLASEEMTLTYGEMIAGRAVLEEVISKLDLAEGPDNIAEKVEVEPIPNTQLIRLSVEDNNKSRAILLADTIAETFIGQNQAQLEELYGDRLADLTTQIDELAVRIDGTQAELETREVEKVRAETELARLESIWEENRNTYTSALQSYDQMQLSAVQSKENVIQVETAQPPLEPSRPRTLLNALIAGLTGALIAVGFAFFLDQREATIKTRDDVTAVLGLDTLSQVSKFNNRQDELVVISQPRSPVVEDFHNLSTKIRYLSKANPLKTILVTSPGIGEGKSIVVANLSTVMAQSGLKVIAVDADIRKPRLHELFKLNENHTGLAGFLQEGSLDGKVQATSIEGLSILSSGDLPEINPAILLSSQRTQDLLMQLVGQADVVLVDCPPVLAVADGEILSRMVDGVLLVIQSERTYKNAARHAVINLQQMGANLLGVVLNAVPSKGYGYYQYYSRQGRPNQNT